MRSVIALLSCVIALTGPLGASRNTAVFAAGDLLGSFDAIDLSGSRWTADDFRGRVVVIDFWATWCAPCLAELPRLKAMREAYSRDDLELIGVMLDPSSRHTLGSWLSRTRIVCIRILLAACGRPMASCPWPASLASCARVKNMALSVDSRSSTPAGTGCGSINWAIRNRKTQRRKRKD